MIFANAPRVLAVSDSLDSDLEEAPASGAVFVIWPREGAPYIARTNVLRRRLKRLLRPASSPSRALNLRTLAERVEYWPFASTLESSLVFWDVARQYAPDDYPELLKLRYPPYVKLVTAIDFPRTQITTRLGGAAGRYYGPFRSRASAEEFDHNVLEFFQLRRCQEEFVPAADHPGCIYGEMGMCLRPCQEVVGPEEYSTEVTRVSEFLRTGGREMLLVAEAARDRLSAELEFEAAAREHKRIARIEQVLKSRDELANDIDQLHGVAVTPSTEPHQVVLWFLLAGVWQVPVPFSIALADQSVSMDRRVKDVVSGLAPLRVPPRERQEHLAILARWFYSSWRDSDWITILNLASAPYRKIIAAISRAAHV